MAKQNEYGWIAWTLGIGAALWVLSRANETSAPNMTTTNAAAANAGATNAATDLNSNAIGPKAISQTSVAPHFLGPPISVGEKDYGSPTAGSSGGLLTGNDPYQTPPIFLLQYHVGDSVTIGPGEYLPPAPVGTQWWTQPTGAQPSFVTYTLEAVGTYHPPIDPRDYV